MSGVGNQAEPRKDKLAPLDRGHILYQLKTNREKVADAVFVGKSSQLWLIFCHTQSHFGETE